MIFIWNIHGMHDIHSIYMVFSMLFVITGTWNRVNWRLLVKIEKLRNLFLGGWGFGIFREFLPRQKFVWLCVLPLVTGDMWHLPFGMWHATRDTWHMNCILHFCCCCIIATINTHRQKKRSWPKHEALSWPMLQTVAFCIALSYLHPNFL